MSLASSAAVMPEPSSASPARRPFAIATLWGFAEATVFFIVPDVFTSRLALTATPLRAFTACLFAVAGALIGGTLLFAAARLSPSTAQTLLTAFDHIPGISPPLIESARQHVATHGSAAFFVSSAAGIPYKVCAIHAALGGVSFPAFLLMSFLARTTRFAAVTTIAALCQRLFLHRFSPKVRTFLHLTVWTLFYAWYFRAISA